MRSFYRDTGLLDVGVPIFESLDPPDGQSALWKLEAFPVISVRV